MRRRLKQNCYWQIWKVLRKTNFSNIERKAKGGDKEFKDQYEFMLKIKTALDEGKPARVVELQNPDETRWAKQLGMLTAKPILYVCNVNEDDASAVNEWSQKGSRHGRWSRGAGCCDLCSD